MEGVRGYYKNGAEVSSACGSHDFRIVSRILTAMNKYRNKGLGSHGTCGFILWRRILSLAELCKVRSRECSVIGPNIDQTEGKVLQQGVSNSMPGFK